MCARPHRVTAGTSSHASTARARVGARGLRGGRVVASGRMSAPVIADSQTFGRPKCAHSRACSGRELLSRSSTHTHTPPRPGATAREAQRLKRAAESMLPRRLARSCARVRVHVSTPPPPRARPTIAFSRGRWRARGRQASSLGNAVRSSVRGVFPTAGRGEGRVGRPRDDDDHGRFRFRWWVCLRGGG